jgi:hypothetical protein
MTEPLHDSRNPNHGRIGGLIDRTTSQAAALANLEKFLRVAKAAKKDGIRLPIWDHDITALENGVTALRQSETALATYRDTNHVLREELKFISARMIEACAKVAEAVQLRMKEECDFGAGIAAREIRTLSQAPVTDGAVEDKIHDLALFIGNESRIYAGLEPYTDIEGPGWDSCRRLARALIAAGRVK